MKVYRFKTTTAKKYYMLFDLVQYCERYSSSTHKFSEVSQKEDNDSTYTQYYFGLTNQMFKILDLPFTIQLQSLKHVMFV